MYVSQNHEGGNEDTRHGVSDSYQESKQALDLSIVICTRNRAQSIWRRVSEQGSLSPCLARLRVQVR